MKPLRLLGGWPDPLQWPDLASDYDAVLAAEPDVANYGPSAGDNALRTLIAERMGLRTGSEVSTDQIVVTNRCAGAIALVANALVDRHSVIALEGLTYHGGSAILRDTGAKIVALPVDQDGMDVDALARHLETERVDLVYTIATCQSPTGTTMSAKRREQLARLADAHDFVIAQDDTYGEIRFDDAPVVPLMALAPDRVVHLGSFSKTMAPGLRAGWIATSVELADRILMHRQDLGGVPVVQRVVARYLADGRYEAQLDEVCSFYRRKRDVLIDALVHHCADVGTWHVPSGGFFVWFLLAERCDADRVAEAAVDVGLEFLPGSYFDAGGPCARGLRLAYSNVATEELEEAAKRLAKAIKAAYGEAALLP
jgi:2-aminoadipate transaminase